MEFALLSTLIAQYKLQLHDKKLICTRLPELLVQLDDGDEAADVEMP